MVWLFFHPQMGSGRLAKKASTCLRSFTAPVAPRAVVQRAPQAVAKRRAAGWSAPVRRDAAKPARKLSPAPVASTVGTEKASSR